MVNGWTIDMVKSEPEYLEGPGAKERFDRAMRHVITVSHVEIQRRLKEARKKASWNPKRGSGAIGVQDRRLPAGHRSSGERQI
jgi:hypothetical protein